MTATTATETNARTTRLAKLAGKGKWVGLAGFTFFFVKGLAWLALFAGAAAGLL